MGSHSKLSSNESALLGRRYQDVGLDTMGLRPEQLACRDRFIADCRSGAYRLESVPCLCGTTVHSADVVLATADRYGIPNRTVLCMQCGLGRVTPRMTSEDYSRFYEGSYREIYTKVAGGAEAVFEHYASGRSEELARWLGMHVPLEGFEVLEIGTGGGWNLAAVEKAGSVVVGYDLDDRFLAVGKRHGLDLRLGGIDEAVSDGRRFDLIVLHHVVEHLLEPQKDLYKLHQMLRPGGTLYIGVPGLLGLHIDKKTPMFNFQNVHVYHFCLRTLVSLMTRSGYRMIVGDEIIQSLWKVCSPSTPAGSVEESTDEFASFVLDYLKLREEHGNRIAGRVRGRPVARRHPLARLRNRLMNSLRSSTTT